MDKFLVKRKLTECPNSTNSVRNISSSNAKTTKLDLKFKSAPVKRIRTSPDIPHSASSLNPFALRTKPAPSGPKYPPQKPQVQSRLSILQKIDNNIPVIKPTQNPPSPTLFHTPFDLESAIQDSVSRQGIQAAESAEAVGGTMNPSPSGVNDAACMLSVSMECLDGDIGADTTGINPDHSAAAVVVCDSSSTSPEFDPAADIPSEVTEEMVHEDNDEEVYSGGDANAVPLTSTSTAAISAAQSSITDYLLQTAPVDDSIDDDDSSCVPSVRSRNLSIDPFGMIGRNSSAPPVFTRDPAIYAHPLRLHPRSRAVLLASRYTHSDAQVHLSMQTAVGGHNLVPKRVGCTCIRFDQDGVLFVMGGSNGVVRLFDFDDVLFASQRAGRWGRSGVDIMAIWSQQHQDGHQSLPAHAGVPHSSQQNASTVTPITSPLCTGKDISDIAWIPPPPDSLREMTEIVVAFTYHSEVHIYDLSLNNQLVCVLNLGGEGGRGNASLLARPLSSGSSVVNVFAGGTYGQVRMWHVTERSRHADSSVSPAWQVSGDHLSRPGTHSCIVGLRPVASHPAWVLSVTRMGVVAVWDTTNVSAASFSSMRSPACVLRVCIWDSALPVSPRASACSTRRLHIAPPPSSMVVGISTPPSPSLYREEAVSEHICITLSSGEIFMFDFLAGRLVTHPVNSSGGAGRSGNGGGMSGNGCPSGNNGLTSSADVVENIQPRGRGAAAEMEGVVVAGLSLGTRDVRCPAVFCEGTGSEICFSGCQGSSRVEVLRLGAIDRERIDQVHRRSRFSLSRGMSSYGLTSGQQWRNWFEEHNKKAPGLQRSATVSHTLPGHVEEAVCGNYTIVMSEDMGPFLCPLTEVSPCSGTDGNCSVEGDRAADCDGVTHGIPPAPLLRTDDSASSPGNIYKSAVVCLDWSVQSVCDMLANISIQGDTKKVDAAAEAAHIGWKGKRKTCTLTRVVGRKVTLDTPYLGPVVTNGYPRVYLRTNLKPGVTPPPSAVPLQDSPPLPSIGMPGERLVSIPLPHAATALEGHPMLPYIVAGCWDDSVTVLSPHSSSRI